MKCYINLQCSSIIVTQCEVSELFLLLLVMFLCRLFGISLI